VQKLDALLRRQGAPRSTTKPGQVATKLDGNSAEALSPTPKQSVPKSVPTPGHNLYDLVRNRILPPR